MANKMKLLMKEIIPKLSLSKHKGQDGRLCVIGGSREYTGAPYFAAISILRAGGDLSHVICDIDAATPIKSYGPDIIVEPYLDTNKNWSNQFDFNSLKRFNAIIIGPGLGRNQNMLSKTADIIQSSLKLKIPMILDGDALYLLSITQYRSLLSSNNHQNIVLSPNAMEFRRLWINHVLKKDINQYIEDKNDYLPPFDTTDLFNEEKSNAFKMDEILLCKDFNDIQHIKDTATLAESMGGITLLRKGAVDIITNGNKFVLLSSPYSLRRCGGQGDILAGIVGLWLHWSCNLYHEQNDNNVIAAAYAASYLTRHFAVEAFNKHNRSTLTTDIIDCISIILEREFPVQNSIVSPL